MKNINEVKFIDYPNSQEARGYTAYPNDFNYVADQGMTGTIAEHVKKIIEHLDELYFPENSDKADIMEKTAPFRKRPNYEKAKHKYNGIRSGYVGLYGYGGSGGSEEASEGSGAEDNDADDAGGMNEIHKALHEFCENQGIRLGIKEDMGCTTAAMAVGDGQVGGVQRRDEDFSGTTADISVGGGTIAGTPSKAKKGSNAYFTTGYTRLHESDYDYNTAEREYHDMNSMGGDAEKSKAEIQHTIDKVEHAIKVFENIIAMSPDQHQREEATEKIVKLNDALQQLKQELQQFVDITEKHIPMTEKEKRIKALAESYGIVKKSSKPIEEEDEEDGDEKEEKGKGPKKGVNPFAKKGKSKDSEDDEEEEDDEEDKPKKKGKGPKKGVNPFAKKKDDDDEESDEDDYTDDSDDEDEFAADADGTEEEHKFKGAGSEVCVYGVSREEAKALAAKLLAPIPGVGPVPVGMYEIKFKVPEEKELEDEIGEEDDEMEEGLY